MDPVDEPLIVRPIELDLEAAMAAYRAADAAAFAAAIAPLGIDLARDTFHGLVTQQRHTDGRAALALRVLYAAMIGDAGVALEKITPETATHFVAIAVRFDDHVVLGVARGSSKDPYGWSNVRRWYKEVARNRAAMVEWATRDPFPVDAIRIPITAPIAKAAPAADDRDLEARLLAPILANPDDIGARLVYADWLIERGDPRGELIQLECSEPSHEIERRLASVRPLCKPGFDAITRGAIYTTSGGFIDMVDMSATILCRHWREIAAAHPIRELRIGVSSTKSLAKVAALGIPAHVKLMLAGEAGEPTTVEIDAPELRPLFAGRTQLAFFNIAAGAVSWLGLLGSPACAALRELAIQIYRLDVDLIEVLGDPAVAPNLEAVVLRSIPFEDPITPAQLAAVEAIGARPKLVRLGGIAWLDEADNRRMFPALLAKASFVELDYRQSFCGTALAAALVATPRAKSLRKVVFSKYLAGPAIAALEASPYLVDCARPFGI